MSPTKQPGSQFWGSGVELTRVRDNLDPVEAQALIATLGQRIFGDRFDYSRVEFRGLNLPVKIIVRSTGAVIETTPFQHLTTEDGYGYRV